jgi:hypothetical protein
MPSVTRLFVHSMLITVTAAVTLMFAVPAALADGCPSPSTLVFAVQPTTTQVQTAMTPAVVVDVENSQGYLESSFNGPVTLTYAVNPVGAPEPANNVVYAVGGVATFPALTFSAIGIGFELQASAEQATSSPSQPFGIATTSQAVTCQPGQTCQSPTVSSDGTSGFAVASAAGTTDVLTASAGYPPLSCTKVGGVLGFEVTNRSKTITMMLSKSLLQQEPGPGAAHFNACWGSPKSFTTSNGMPSTFNSANNEFEGLLPDCSTGGPSPCVISRHKTNAGVEVITVSAPSGDPRISG